jgi:hypothetical protein
MIARFHLCLKCFGEFANLLKGVTR